MTEHYLTDERRMIQDVAREFTKNEVLPAANALDPIQGEIPMALRNKMGEMGYFGIQMSEEHGGMGLGRLRVLLGCRGAGPGLDERGQHHRPGGVPDERRRLAGGQAPGTHCQSRPGQVPGRRVPFRTQRRFRSRLRQLPGGAGRR